MYTFDKARLSGEADCRCSGSVFKYLLNKSPGNANVAEMAKALQISPKIVYKHTKTLKQLGIITSETKKVIHGETNVFRINPDNRAMRIIDYFDKVVSSYME